MKKQPSNPCEKVSFILTYDQLEAAYNIYREQFISCDFIRRSLERLEERIGLCNLPYETLRDDPNLLHEAYLQFIRLEDCNVAYNDTLEQVFNEIEQRLATGILSPTKLTVSSQNIGNFWNGGGCVMANICCDDVIFYTEGNPEGLYDLWEDLETYIILNQNPDLCWIGNLFSHKKIASTGISLRGNVSYMEWNDTYILLSLETAWTPLYEAYQAIAAAYHVPFVMQSIEPGERIYYNTDEAHLFFPDRYCVRLYEESLLTPCGLIIGEKLEDGEPFETETDVLERFRDCGYPAATLKELELMFDADELIIFEFTNPYLDLEQKNACA